MPLRQRRSGPVSDKDDYGETGVPQIEISQAPLPESLQKPGPAIQRAVSSEGSYASSLDPEPDTDHGHNETPYSSADDHTILDNVTYSLHITFEDQKVSSSDVSFSKHPNHLPSYEDIASQSKEFVAAHFGRTVLGGRSINFRHGRCSITNKNNDKSLGHIRTRPLSTDADWKDLCTSLASLEGHDIHLDIHRDYFGLSIPRKSDEKFAYTKRKEIFKLMEKSGFNQRYLPRSDLSKVVSMNEVREIITDDSTVHPDEKESLIRRVYDRAPKLFIMFVLARMDMKCLKRMLEKGQDDNTNPLGEQHCCHKDHEQEFVEELLKYHRELNAATFLHPGEHQELSDETVLPIHFQSKAIGTLTSEAQFARDASEEEIRNDEKNRDTDKEKALCGHGAFSNVYRVRLHPAHHNLTKVSELSCIPMVFISRVSPTLLNRTYSSR